MSPEDRSVHLKPVAIEVSDNKFATSVNPLFRPLDQDTAINKLTLTSNADLIIVFIRDVNRAEISGPVQPEINILQNLYNSSKISL